MGTTFGSLVTAMVTPFDPAGQIDYAKAQELAAYLVDTQRNEAIVVNGTTGESPTTTDSEKAKLISAVKEAIGNRAKVVAGVGTFSTEHTLQLAREAESLGADGLLVVTPYYSRPPQDAVAAHFEAVADATGLPVILYDIPHRAGIPIETATLLRVAKHPRIVGVKDAKGNAAATAQVLAETDLVYYCGDDPLLLPWLALGAVGVVGTSTHFTGARTRRVIDSFNAGDVAAARAEFRALLPVYTGVFATQGCMLVKAGLNARGMQVGGVRAPLLPANAAETAAFVALLEAAGL